MSLSYRYTDSHVYFLGGYFSQWSRTAFKGCLPLLGDNGLYPIPEEIRFETAEQFMMASKATLFGDLDTLIKIIETTNPSKQKQLGREVKKFEKEIWDTYARHIVTIGNYYKFTQDHFASKELALSESRYLVEGAWYDTIWGVGIAWDNDVILDEKNWRGTNWLGESIMAVRDVIGPPVVDPYTIDFKWVSDL